MLTTTAYSLRFMAGVLFSVIEATYLPKKAKQEQKKFKMRFPSTRMEDGTDNNGHLEGVCPDLKAKNGIFLT